MDLIHVVSEQMLETFHNFAPVSDSISDFYAITILAREAGKDSLAACITQKTNTSCKYIKLEGRRKAFGASVALVLVSNAAL